MALSPAKAKQSDDPHDVYVAYDAADRVIYVGQSISALQRLAQHRYTSAWGRMWAKIELRSFPAKADALDFEAALIRAHSPPHNHDQPRSLLACALCAPEAIASALDSYARFANATGGLSPDGFRDLVAHAQLIARMRPNFSKQKV